MAANSIAKLAVLITGDASPLQTTLRSASQSVSQFAGSFGGGTGIASAATAAAPYAAIAAAAVAAGAAVIGFAKAGIEAAASMEQARISFEVMTGSAAAGLQMVNDLRSFAAETPMNFTDIQQAAKTLMAMGEDSRLVIDDLEMLGNVSAGTGQRLNELAQVFGQVMQAGRLTGNELRQFNERGVPLLTTLATQLGKTKMEIREMVEAGELGSDKVVAAFKKMTGEGGLFANMMGRQVETLAGQWEKLKENLTIISSETMKNFAVVLTDMLRHVNAILDAIVRWYGIERQKNEESKKATEEVRKQLTLENQRVEAAKKSASEMKKAGEDHAKQLEKAADRAKSIRESLRTPGEIYKATTKEMADLMQQGLLSTETFKRGIDKALEDFESATNKKKQIEKATDTRVGAVERFTMAGFSAMQRSGESKKLEDNTKKTADNTLKTSKVVEDLAIYFKTQRQQSDLTVSNF